MAGREGWLEAEAQAGETGRQANKPDRRTHAQERTPTHARTHTHTHAVCPNLKVNTGTASSLRTEKKGLPQPPLPDRRPPPSFPPSSTSLPNPFLPPGTFSSPRQPSPASSHLLLHRGRNLSLPASRPRVVIQAAAPPMPLALQKSPDTPTSCRIHHRHRHATPRPAC